MVMVVAWQMSFDVARSPGQNAVKTSHIFREGLLYNDDMRLVLIEMYLSRAQFGS